MGKARTVAVIQSELDAAKVKASDVREEIGERNRKFNESLRDLSKLQQQLGEEINTLMDELVVAQVAENPAPCQPGDVVEDELGVRYRVTHVWAPDTRPGRWRNNRWEEGRPGVWTVLGIRLQKNGAEAYANPREINSPHLTVVTI